MSKCLNRSILPAHYSHKFILPHFRLFDQTQSLPGRHLSVARPNKDPTRAYQMTNMPTIPCYTPSMLSPMSSSVNIGTRTLKYFPIFIRMVSKTPAPPSDCFGNYHLGVTSRIMAIISPLASVKKSCLKENSISKYAYWNVSDSDLVKDFMVWVRHFVILGRDFINGLD